MASDPSVRAAAHLSDSALDPLASPRLQAELPGIRTAFDEQAMREQLQLALAGQPAGALAIETCEVDQATYVAGVGCTVRYVVAVRDASGASHTRLVSGQVFPDAASCRAYLHDALAPLVGRVAGRAETAPFPQPVGMIEAPAMAVFAFPIDGDLPALIEATEAGRMRGALRSLLPAIGLQVPEQSDCRAELVDYGRQRRCTLRYHLGDVTVYGKLTGDGSGAMAGDISAALIDVGQRAPTGVAFRIPRVLAWLPDLQLSLLEAIPGKDVVGDMVKARLRGKPAPTSALTLEETIEVCARIGAALHTSGSTIGPRRTIDDELASLGRALAQVQAYAPELGALLAAGYDQIAARAQGSGALPLCFNHGDFTAGQFLFDGATSGLVDFDSVCQAEPALDVAQFLTYLRVGGLKSKHTPEQTRAIFEGLTERFFAAYQAGAGLADTAQLRERVALYSMISLLRRVLRSWQKMKPARIISALEMLQAELAA